MESLRLSEIGYSNFSEKMNQYFHLQKIPFNSELTEHTGSSRTVCCSYPMTISDYSNKRGQDNHKYTKRVIKVPVILFGLFGLLFPTSFSQLHHEPQFEGPVNHYLLQFLTHRGRQEQSKNFHSQGEERKVT